MTTFQCGTLNDVISLVIDYRGKTPKKLGSDWSNSGYRALSAKNIKTGQIVQPETIRYVDQSLYTKWMKDEIQRGDILITSEAPFGQVLFWDSDEKIVLSQRIFGLRVKENFCPAYIYYYMTSSDFQYELDSRATGTTVTGLRQPELLKCKICYPDKKQQEQIAKILCKIDNKISLNTAINNNLEQQAQALFKSWFIDFEPFGGTRPKDWEQVTLENCTDLISRGYNTKYVEKSQLLNLNQKANRGSFIEKKHYKYLDESIPVPAERFAKKGDVLVNSMGVGTIGRTHYWNSEDANTVVDQCITIVRYKPNVTTGEFLYLLLTSSEYVSYIEQHITGSTGMVSLNISAVRDCNIFLPKWDVLESFHNFVSPLYEKIENNVAENERLAAIRDALLPKLMSGEIDVSKVDISDPSYLDKLLFSEETE